ncbi:hypothetical protein F7725_021913 [Dissostichus mawsoni]|uniref:Uncharacterized protein n=1 Tax=Dissostichus mawsoni TaxID=36200 RepID=A0A7J5ZCI0_DISMA|nr:hypothetical protein F7725_021913 [Dissostichus mawsoni]
MRPWAEGRVDGGRKKGGRGGGWTAIDPATGCQERWQGLRVGSHEAESRGAPVAEPPPDLPRLYLHAAAATHHFSKLMNSHAPQGDVSVAKSLLGANVTAGSPAITPSFPPPIPEYKAAEYIMQIIRLETNTSSAFPQRKRLPSLMSRKRFSDSLPPLLVTLPHFFSFFLIHRAVFHSLCFHFFTSALPVFLECSDKHE